MSQSFSASPVGTSLAAQPAIKRSLKDGIAGPFRFLVRALRRPSASTALKPAAAMATRETSSW